jgi:hypothetical protein
MKRLGRGCRAFGFSGLKEQFRQEALPIIPNSFQPRACIGAEFSQEQEKWRVGNDGRRAQSRARVAQARSCAINDPLPSYSCPKRPPFPSSAPANLAAASPFPILVLTIAIERLSSFVYRQSQSAVTL